MKGKAYPDAVRAQIMVALLTGSSVNDVARAFRVSPATVSRVKASLCRDGLKQLETEKHARLGGLVLNLLETSLATLMAQARVVSDPEYLRQQSATQVAALHNALAVQTFRMLELASAMGIH